MFSVENDRATRRQQERRRRFLVETLEGRQLLSTFSVTNTNDSGTGSLRQATISSNATTGPIAINFSIPGGGAQTISLRSALPALAQPVTIDGTTEPGSNGLPVIQIDGTSAGGGVIGLDVAASASGSTLKGLAVTDFSVGGIFVSGASHVMITDDDLGLVQLSSGVFVHGDNNFGVELEGRANHDTLSGDVISTNAYYGVYISDSGRTGNVVEGNDIGTDASSTSPMGNAINGIQIDSGASSNVIGGSNAYATNLIEYNGSNGVGIGAGSFSNTIQYDIINLNAANGVFFAGASGNAVVDCTIEANGQWGILDQGSNNYYAYNTIYDNLDGSVGT